MKIIINNQNKKIPKEILEKCNKDEVLAKIFYNRGIKNIKDFDNYIDNKKYIPYDVKEFPPMLEACKIIKDAINKKEKIAVYGDYDVDGITATSILVLGLRRLKADVIYHVPDRFSEGYGMNLAVVEGLYNQGVKLIITCDCGISNFNEIARAKELGMTVILTDHHTIGESIPNADVVINYKLLPEGHPVRDVSGCATAYFVIKALNEYLNTDIGDNYLDLVALSIISDVIPLRGESRYLFKEGFKELQNPNRIGLKALKDVMNIEEVSVEDIGFQITPRLNAVGRMDTARTGVELFLTDNIEQANSLAIEIDRFNTDRKNIQREIYEKAKDIVESEKKNKKILILYGDNWHHGIIGIVAGRICEEYKKPCIVLTTNDKGEIVGSARSTERLNIYETLAKFSDDMIKFGGHAQAAGMSLRTENLKKFTEDLENYADIYLADDYEETVYVDYLLPFDKISEDLLEKLAIGEPYGEAFPAPKFVTPNVKIEKEKIIKDTHHFMTLMDNTRRKVGTTLWNYGDEELEGKNCTIIYNIYRDTYNGRNEIKIKIEEILFDNVEIVENKVKWIDKRKENIEKIINEYPKSSIFYSGPKLYKPEFDTIGEKYDEKVNYLILYSVPQSNRILNELIENTCPDHVILNYSYIPKYDSQSFQNMFRGVIKNTVNNLDGIIKIEEFAKIMQVDEEFIITYSKFLEEMGYIKFSKTLNKELKYTIINTRRKCNNKSLTNIVTKYLKEKDEYIKYMVNSPICDKLQEE